MHPHCSLSSVFRMMINMLSQVLSAKKSNKEAFITRKWIRAYAILNLFPEVLRFFGNFLLTTQAVVSYL